MFCAQLRKTKRPGAAAVELAVLAPLLCFFLVIGMDFARIFYFALTVTNCARNGALYGSMDTTHSQDGQGIEAAALADASNVSPAPKVSSTSGTDTDGHRYLEVTVEYRFQTVVEYPGVPHQMDLIRTVRMRVAPDAPDDPIPSATP